MKTPKPLQTETCTYFVNVDAMIERPYCLEVILHPLLELLRYLVQREEILKVPPLGLVQRPSRVHPLNYRRHVTEHHGVHQGCGINTVMGQRSNRAVFI